VSKINIRINRQVDIGEYHITDIFPGLENNPIFLEVFKDKDEISEVFEDTKIKIIERQTYMFVDNDNGAISIGIGHLKTSTETVLYLDIIHELVHVRQHREGLDLYDRSVAYVDRPTEIEAYVLTIEEARRIGLNDKEILDYLEVEWITPEEHIRLAKRLNVSYYSK
jgi:hypothetical protein